MSYRFGESRRLAREQQASELVAEALSFYNKQEYDKASDKVEQALRLDPNNDLAKQLQKSINDALLIEKLLDEKKTREISDLTKTYESQIADLQTKYDELSKGKTDALRRQYESEKAAAIAKLKSDFNTQIVRQQKEYETKLKQLETETIKKKDVESQELVKKAIADEVFKSQHYAEGLELLASEDYNQAIVEFETVARYDPNYLDVRKNINLAKNATKDASAYSKEILELYYKGMDEFVKKDYAKAIAVWKEMLKKDEYNKLALKGIKEAEQRLRTLEAIK
jgi:tetratricopeptide (TPR) repeat protein